MKLIILLVALLTSCGGSTDNTTTFLEYSLTNKNSRAELVNDAGQNITSWTRTVLPNQFSSISWSKDTDELFSYDNDWVYAVAFRDKNPDYDNKIYAVKQTFCQLDRCQQITDPGELVKYAPILPRDNYTLDTVGYIVHPTSGRINFRDYQSVSVNVACSNPYYSNRRCLVQDEQWWDDNQSAFTLKYDRITWFAAGLGPGFIIKDRLGNWTVYLK